MLEFSEAANITCIPYLDKLIDLLIGEMNELLIDSTFPVITLVHQFVISSGTMLPDGSGAPASISFLLLIILQDDKIS